MTEPILRRYWFEFEIPPLENPFPGVVSLDGGTAVQRYLSHGCGVTGYDERDCLKQVEQLLEGEGLPPVVTVDP